MATVTPPRTSHHHHHAPLLYHVDRTPAIFGTASRRRTCFSAPDLDYKMKMMQLKLHFRAASTAVGTDHQRSPTDRHSIETFFRPAVEPTPGTGHSPKILAVQPKFRPVNAVKPGCSNNPLKVLVSVKSATLPNVPQQTKVKRLVRLFEDSSGTTVPATTTRVKQLQIKVKPAMVRTLVKPVQEVKPEEAPKPVAVIRREVILKSPTVQQQKNISKFESPVEPVKEDASAVDDQAIKDALRQRRKVKELCKFFENQANH